MDESIMSAAELPVRPATRGESPGQYEIDLIVSDKAYAYLRQIAEDHGTDLADAVRRAVGLHMMATRARREGKSVVILGSDGEPESELVGF